MSIVAFRCIEKGESLSRILAIIGLVSCAIGVIMQLLMIWGIIAKIDENSTSVTPLKYTALICGICFWLVAVMMIFVNASDFTTLYTKGLPLISVISAVFAVTAATAILMSWFNRKDKIDATLNHIDKVDDKGNHIIIAL